MAGKAFRKGIALVDLMEMFPDDEVAEDWFIQTRWPNGVACPNCGSVNINDHANHPTMPFHCRDCRKFFQLEDRNCDAQFQSSVIVSGR